MGSSGLFKDVLQIKADNISDGYVAVTTAEELKTALGNNENIVLMNVSDSLSIILLDEMLNELSEYQTKLGASQNRLESAINFV